MNKKKKLAEMSLIDEFLSGIEQVKDLTTVDDTIDDGLDITKKLEYTDDTGAKD